MDHPVEQHAVNLHTLRAEICLAEAAEQRRTTPQPWLRLDVPSEFYNFDNLPLEFAIEHESTRGYIFQCHCLVGHTCRINQRCECGALSGDCLAAIPVLSTFFRPQAAGEPYPLVNRDGPIQWLEDIISFGIRDFTYPLTSDPLWIKHGYITKATRETIFSRNNIFRWPSGYTTPRPINLFTYRQIELHHQLGVDTSNQDYLAYRPVNGIDTSVRRDWIQPRYSFLYGNIENMSLDDPLAHPLLRHEDILPPRALRSQLDTFNDRHQYGFTGLALHSVRVDHLLSANNPVTRNPEYT